MFMLRCIFWLSVMVASLPIGSDLVGDWQGTREAATTGIAGAAVAQAGTWCAAHPAQCARDAGRLTALVVATTRLDPAWSEDPAIAPAHGPVRHHAAKIVLTDRR